MRMKTVVLKSAQVQNGMEYIHALWSLYPFSVQNIVTQKEWSLSEAIGRETLEIDCQCITRISLQTIADSQRGEMMQ